MNRTKRVLVMAEISHVAVLPIFASWTNLIMVCTELFTILPWSRTMHFLRTTMNRAECILVMAKFSLLTTIIFYITRANLVMFSTLNWTCVPAFTILHRHAIIRTRLFASSMIPWSSAMHVFWPTMNRTERVLVMAEISHVAALPIFASWTKLIMFCAMDRAHIRTTRGWILHWHAMVCPELFAILPWSRTMHFLRTTMNRAECVLVMAKFRLLTTIVFYITRANLVMFSTIYWARIPTFPILHRHAIIRTRLFSSSWIPRSRAMHIIFTTMNRAERVLWHTEICHRTG